MKLPLWLTVLILVIVVSGVVGLVLSPFCNDKLLENVANFSLVLTLAAILAYVYYTYMLAKDAWTPSASFELKPYPNDPYHFAFIIRNHSKVSLNCWCDLNASVYGQAVSLDGFYGAKHSVDLQPYGSFIGNFDIRDILAKANRTLQEMKQKSSAANSREQLYLNIDFWYKPSNADVKIPNPRQPHFFDFDRDALVAHF